MVVLGLVSIGSAPALAANYHDYHAWSRPNDSGLVSYHPGYATPVLSRGYYYAHPVRDKRETR
jgi:hypothetical protein